MGCHGESSIGHVFFFSGFQSPGGDLENEAVDLVWKPEFLIGKMAKVE